MNKCKRCNKDIPDNKKFCSRHCYSEYNKKTIKCKFCNKEMRVPKSDNRKYCSNQCVANDLGSIKRESAKKTLLEKYGVSHQSQLKSVKEKIKNKRKKGAYDNVTEKMKQYKF